ncbi:hypothetical protein HOY80DRAFT_993441 [Tuber brumale]|nr:hypothetical protein HOY80DRAFT_993441 [Tuber brumale]
MIRDQVLFFLFLFFLFFSSFVLSSYSPALFHFIFVAPLYLAFVILSYRVDGCFRLCFLCFVSSAPFQSLV